MQTLTSAHRLVSQVGPDRWMLSTPRGSFCDWTTSGATRVEQCLIIDFNRAELDVLSCVERWELVPAAHGNGESCLQVGVDLPANRWYNEAQARGVRMDEGVGRQVYECVLRERMA